MKAVILAAGRGTRIRAATEGRPKCLLEVGDRTLLDWQVDWLFHEGVSDVGIVVGYRKQDIVSHLALHHPDKMNRIRFIENTNYLLTNNMYSFWLARHWTSSERFICLNADVLCHPSILGLTMASDEDIAVAVDPEFREETTKVVIEGDRVTAFGKTLTREECSGTFVNIAAFSARGARAIFKRAEARFADQDFGCFYNDILNQMAGEGTRIGAVNVQYLPWAEIDDPADLEFARRSVFPELHASLRLTHERLA